MYNNFYYGAHMSIKNGIPSAIAEINELGGNLIQIFVSNPMSTKTTISKFTDNIITSIKNKMNETDSKIVIHLPYVINLAKTLTPKMEDSWWINMICEQLKISDSINSIGCVVHVGKYLDLTESDGLDNMLNAFRYIIKFIKDRNMKTYIILETAAGQGSELISKMDDFMDFYNKFTKEDKNYIKVCIDTCHIFAAGYDIKKEEQVKKFFDDFNEKVGIEHITLIHLNDSKTECGTCVDRHANLGEGKIGITGLRHFIRYAAHYKIPLVLETPGDNLDKEINLITTVKNGVNKWSAISKRK
jgi:deoxyribonuclease-4